MFRFSKPKTKISYFSDSDYGLVWEHVPIVSGDLCKALDERLQVGFPIPRQILLPGGVKIADLPRKLSDNLHFCAK